MNGDPMLLYDDDAHLYMIEDVEVPSVTQAMFEAGIIDTRFYTEWGKHRGSRVHQAIDLKLKGTLDEESVDPRIQGYLDAYDHFTRETGFVAAEWELPMWSRKEMFAGTLDQVGQLGDGKTAIVDTKTGRLAAAVGLQLTGYAVLYQEMRGKFVDALVGLQLLVDGSYRIKRYVADFSTWRAVLQVARWKREN